MSDRSSSFIPTNSPLIPLPPRHLEDSEVAVAFEKTLSKVLIPHPLLPPPADESQTAAVALCKALHSNQLVTTTTANVTATSASSRKRIVQFESDPDCPERSVKRRTVELPDVPPSSQMSLEEKRDQFMQSEDRQEICQGVDKVVHACLNQDAATDEGAYAVYAETLATTYSMCHADNSVEDELPLNEMTCLGVHHTQARGLETRIIPGFAEDRLLKRRELVQGVLDVQNELRQQGKTVDEIHDDLGMVSEYLSKPAKQFARALGVVDGTSALLEYAQDEASESNSPVVGPVDSSLLSSTPLVGSVAEPIRIITNGGALLFELATPNEAQPSTDGTLVALARRMK